MPFGFNFAYLTFTVPMFFCFSAFFLYGKAKTFQSSIKLIIYKMIRLFPMYWIAVCFSSIVRIIGGEKIDLLRFLANLTMIEDVLGFEQIDGAYWTLFYELMLLLMLAVFSFITFNKENLIKKAKMLCYIWLSLGTFGSILLKILNNNSSSMAVLMFGCRYIPVFTLGILYYEYYIEKN